MAALGKGERTPVRVTLNGCAYRSTVACEARLMEVFEKAASSRRKEFVRHVQDA